MDALKILLYALATITSFACTAFLLRGYLRSRVRLLFWSSLCFVGLTVSNILLFADFVIFPTADLRLVRLIASMAGLVCLLYAFIWESDRNGGQK